MEPGALKPDMTRDELGAALTAYILGATSMVSRATGTDWTDDGPSFNER